MAPRVLRRAQSLGKSGWRAAPVAFDMATGERRTVAPIVGSGRSAAVHGLRDRGRSGLHGGGPRRASRSSASRGSSRSRAAPYPDMYRRAAVDDAPVRGVRVGEGVQRALQVPARARLDRAVDGVRPADAARVWTPTTRARWVRSAAPGSRSTRSTTCAPRSTGSRSREVSTSMTINAPAAVLLLLYQLVGEEQGVDPGAAARHDAERRAQGVHRPRELHLPAGAVDAADDRPVRLLRARAAASGTRSRSPATTCARRAPRRCRRSPSRWPTASPTCRPRWTPGLDVDEFGPRLAFFFNGHNNVFQEVAKFRAARRMWAHIMRDRFGATNPKAQTLRFHTQTGGVTLTAQQPQNNVVRVALQAFAAVCGGTQSLHTNGYDEALALPSERAAKLALRTQQIIAHESGATDTVDPFAGSYFVEALTDEIEQAPTGSSSTASTSSAARSRRSASSSARSTSPPGATASATAPSRTSSSASTATSRTTPTSRRPCRVDPATERAQVERLQEIKAGRDADVVERHLQAIRAAARGHREPAARAARGAARPLLGRRGLRRDARRLRHVSSGRMIAVRQLLRRRRLDPRARGGRRLRRRLRLSGAASALGPARTRSAPSTPARSLIWSRVVTPAMVVVLLAGIVPGDGRRRLERAAGSPAGSSASFLLFGIVGRCRPAGSARRRRSPSTSDPAYDDLARRLNTAAVAAMVLVVVVLFLMVVKP